MHRTERMGADGIFRKMVILVIFTPFLLVIFNFNGVVEAQGLGSPACVSFNDSVLVAGDFRYLNVTVLNETEKITIVAFSGETPPMQENRSSENYYQWEYTDGIWTDASGYATSYIDLPRCHRENDTVSFCIRISQSAKPGSWRFVILVDNKEISSTSLKVIVGDFCLFLSTIIGVFEPPVRQKYFFQENEVKPFEKEKKLAVVVKENIEKIVDATSKERVPVSREDEPINRYQYLCRTTPNPTSQHDALRPTVSLYPRSKLRDEGMHTKASLVLGKLRGDKNGFSAKNIAVQKRLVMIIVLFMMMSTSVLPIIVMVGRNEGLGDITILNLQSYPVVGGQWAVLFTTVGCANLTISAVNGTTWSNSDQDYDLEFLRCLRGNETLEYTWANNSVCIPAFSSNETNYEISKVLSPGSHTLMFQFGTTVAFAHNLASENWLQTSTNDFNNGTKTNINVSSGSFHLKERFLLRNLTRINNQGFEGSWPPTGWSEVPPSSDWQQDASNYYEGTYSAGLIGNGGPGGASGNLVSSSMDCSGSNVTAIYVKFWALSHRGTTGSYYLDYYDGTTWNQITALDSFGVDAWTQYSQRITSSQYFKSNFQIRWRVSGLQNNRYYNVDLVNVTVERNESGYYSTGNLLSKAHDTTRTIPSYNNIVASTTIPSGTSATTWVRAADTQANLSTATWYTTASQLPQKRWVQWRINLTGNTYLTPTIYDVNLTWTYDNQAPVSSVTPLSPYWQTTTPLAISATASDNGTGVKEVALYYNYSANNATGWSGWRVYGTNDSTSPYGWSFTPPQGDGFYRFFSRAVDNELNRESIPSTPDTLCCVDTVKPSSQVDTIRPYWYQEPNRKVIVNCSTASDATSGITSIKLYYRYRLTNSSSWGLWQYFTSDNAAPWSWTFNFPYAKGFYQFYSIAVDRAGNTEDPPVTPDHDAECAYNSTRPFSMVNSISPYWHSTSLTITGQGTDMNGSGLHNVTLYYYFSSNNATWSSARAYGADSDPWKAISWVFTFPNGTGYYRFYSLAIDNESNVEYFTGNDTFCGFENGKPSSRIDTISTYWHGASSNPLSITVTNASGDLSGVKNITLYYRYRGDNASSWNAPGSFGVDNAAPWAWSFNFPNGEGHYRFYSIAYDLAGNRENPPASPDYDTQCGYATSTAYSKVNYISPYAIMITPWLLNATASDNSKNVTLWFYYSSRNSTWWSPYWGYRKQLNISGNNLGYQMKIIVGNLTGGNVNCNGHTRSDFSDIRFVSYSDNTSLLSYWRKNFTAGVQATFWVNNSRNDSSIWLYYGNSNATTTSSGDATFYFFDDFSNGLSKWYMDSFNNDAILVNQSQGNPSPSLKHLPDNSIPGNRTYQDTRIRTATFKMRNGTIDYDVYLAGTPRIIHQFGWRVNSLSWSSGYGWRLQNANGDGGFLRYTAPTSWTLIGTTFPNAAVNTWYHVTLNVSGSNYASNVNPACGGATSRSVTDATKLTSDYLVSHVHGVSMDATNYVLVDNVIVRKYRATPPAWGSIGSEQTGYTKWSNASNPDTAAPWNWNFNFPNSYGYYWFYSIAVDQNGNKENPPSTWDARCRYVIPVRPVINSYDLRNTSGSKLDNTTGLLDVNKEYYFTVNVTAKYGWVYVDYIDIKAWYDQGSETRTYNQTLGGNLNMYLRYENVTGTASFKLLWPKNEVLLITGNCTQTIINSTTRIIKISFKPLSQIRWASSNNTWDATKNTTNDPYSWNFNITVIDSAGRKSWKKDEYGVYRFATLIPDKNWVNVYAPPGYNATTDVVNITYSSNYNYNISIFFRENLTNISSGNIIHIANNVYLLASADLTDDVTTDIMFTGIGETHAVNIITTSGVFHRNETSAVVHVQFNVYIPFGTLKGLYTAHVGSKIKQKP